MGIMDVIRKMSANKSEKSEKFKEMQEQDRLETMLEERKKSSNRRELEKHLKYQEEKEVKRQLDIIRKQRNKDSWKGDSILKGGKSILHTDKKALSSGKSILKDKNIFLDHKAKNSVTKEDMFFKW